MASNTAVAAPGDFGDGDWSLDALRKLKSEELDGLLRQCFEMNAITLNRMAAIVAVKRERGEELPALRGRMGSHLLKIASGQLLAETLIRFGSNTTLFDRVAALPIEEQRRLIAGEQVKLLVFDGEGKTTHMLVAPGELRPAQVAQAFADGRLATESEQAAFLAAKRTRQILRKSDQPARIGGFEIDYEKGGAWHRKTFFPLHVFTSVVKSLQGK